MYHCHTDFSLLDSCTNYQEYVDLCVKYGSPALSISEHGKPRNWTEKWAACKKAGIKYIHSVEIYLTETLDEKIRDNYHTVLMARNMDGLRELNTLISKSCDDEHSYYTNRITFDEFLGMSSNIISTSACLASPLNKLPESHPRYLDLANKYDFFEVQPHNHPEQIEFNKKLVDLSKKLNKPLIAGTDTHSSNKYKSECRSVLLSSKGQTYGDEDLFDLTYKTYDELVEMFRIQNAMTEEEYLEAINNTNLLDEMTEEIELDVTIKYPITYGSREKDAEVLDERVKSMFESKLASGIIPEHQKEAFETAIEEEMRVFRKLGMDGFILSMSELVSWCRDNDIALGTARGSVGGSRVAYVTDIIDLNPETWKTVFSRFCNEDRVEIGDIDIDCIESDRPRIFDHIINKFGATKTARVASYGTIQDRKAIEIIGRHLAKVWSDKNSDGENPWSIKNVAKIKKEFTENEEKTKKKYPELFYYFDGLINVKESQSVHPAGMVISPITLFDNFGTFDKDGEICLFLDMDNVHDYTGLAKYDFLVLKTVQVIRDTCRYIGIPYPRSHEINWDDLTVWEGLKKSASCIFQFEGRFAADSLKKFAPQNIFDMSIVTACIRPSGKSYRDDLLDRKIRKNPSEIIDDLLKDNLGYLIYQEDTIKFLQLVCGLSGSESDNIRRAIGRKDKDRLDKAMPSILDGYCDKSTLSREDAESEAKEFLQIIEDSAEYQFGYNHSIAYCLLGYLCGYFREYYPIEFITAFLNDAANDEDIQNGTILATAKGIKIASPKWGISRGDYAYDKDRNIIAKGLSSIKYMGASVADELYELSKSKFYPTFIDILKDIDKKTRLNARQLEILIKLDFFSEYGNQRELMRIQDIYLNMFSSGDAKQIKKDKVDGTPLGDIVQKYSVGVTKSGGIAKSYTLLDIDSILYEVEEAVKASNISDLSDTIKAKNFVDMMGYMGYTSGKPEDRRKLYILDLFPVHRKADGKQFGYNIITKSIGSGKECRFTVFNREFNKSPIAKGDIIYCSSYKRNGEYYDLTGYRKIV